MSEAKPFHIQVNEALSLEDAAHTYMPDGSSKFDALVARAAVDANVIDSFKEFVESKQFYEAYVSSFSAAVALYGMVSKLELARLLNARSISRKLTEGALAPGVRTYLYLLLNQTGHLPSFSVMRQDVQFRSEDPMNWYFISAVNLVPRKAAEVFTSLARDKLATPNLIKMHLPQLKRSLSNEFLPTVRSLMNYYVVADRVSIATAVDKLYDAGLLSEVQSPVAAENKQMLPKAMPRAATIVPKVFASIVTGKHRRQQLAGIPNQAFEVAQK